MPAPSSPRPRPGTRIVQMGAGFVGCIIMEGLLSRGVDLTILVRSGYMVRRMMNPTASGLIQRWCESKGVKILTRTQPTAVTSNGDALQVDLGEGRTLPADLYLSVVGVDPNLDFLAGSGIEIGQGILVDASLQSSVPGVYAAGDVAESTDCLTGKRAAERHPAERRRAGPDRGAEHGGQAGPFPGQFRVQRAHDPRPGLVVVRGVAGCAGRRNPPRCSTSPGTAT